MRINLRYLLPTEFSKCTKIVKWNNGHMFQLKSTLQTMYNMAYQQQVPRVNNLDGSQVLNFCVHQKTVGKWKSIMKVSMMQILKLKAVKVNAIVVDGNNTVIDALERVPSWKKMRHLVEIMLK